MFFTIFTKSAIIIDKNALATTENIKIRIYLHILAKGMIDNPAEDITLLKRRFSEVMIVNLNNPASVIILLQLRFNVTMLIKLDNPVSVIFLLKHRFNDDMPVKLDNPVSVIGL